MCEYCNVNLSFYQEAVNRGLKCYFQTLRLLSLKKSAALITIPSVYLAEGKFTCDSDFTSALLGPAGLYLPPRPRPRQSAIIVFQPYLSSLFHHPQTHLWGEGGHRGRTALLTNPALGAVLFHCLRCSLLCFNLWANMQCALNARAGCCGRQSVCCPPGCGCSRRDPKH